jgi:Holliday junction resolvase
LPGSFGPKTPNPSIEGTLSGLRPPSAPHVKRWAAQATMPIVPPPDLAHLLHEALTRLGWAADPQQLAQRLTVLNTGLPQEDEFAVVCSWLGRCSLIHKLDQSQAPPASTERFRVPDLLAVFERDGRTFPVLIEVKSSVSRTLSFRPDYHQRLKAYGSTLGLPVLIAWKHHGLWSLFDIDHMSLAKKNLNITLGKALSESLLGVLAGDFTYTLPRGTGLHLRMRKDELLSTTRNDSEIHEEWRMVVDDTYHTDRDGTERRDIEPDIQALFFVNSLEERQEHTPTHILWHFTVDDDENKFAHMALSGLLNWYLGSGDSLNWREVVARHTPVPGVNDFAGTVERALHQKIVKYILHVQPQTIPPFLGAA